MKEQKQYSVGIYCRLSKDDIGVGDSSSIISQKHILEKYADDNGWPVYDCYIDDGYTGMNYNRPDFRRMIDDIEAGKINLIEVKDLSRLGRNYLLTGQYTDIYFPDRGVRFIALNDGIDSINADNDIAPFRNILNQMYSTDISKKVRSAIGAKKQRGEFLSSYAPYGYQKDPANKNRLIIEDRGAEVVRRMYEMCAGGQGSRVISNMLNKEGILSPICHRDKLIGHESGRISRWNCETVNSILRSRIYLGDMVQGVYECSRFKRTPNKRRPKEEWIITPNTHEPLVAPELWEQAQTRIDSRKRVTRTGELQLFAGFVKCEDCGSALAYSNAQGIPQYTCGRNRRFGKEGCTCHYIRKDTLVEIVLNDIRKHARLAAEDEDQFAQQLQSMHGGKEERQMQALTNELSAAKIRYSELDRIIKRLFEQLVSGTVTDSRFQKLNTEYEAEQAGLEKRIGEIQTDLETIRQNERDSSAWLGIIKEYADIRELDRILLSELIDKITVGEARMVDGEKVIDVTIYYRFIGAVGQFAA
jgi:DNA invertase Pin-like site-specific DNA recombinase